MNSTDIPEHLPSLILTRPPSIVVVDFSDSEDEDDLLRATIGQRANRQPPNKEFTK
jgi:hypothetical protein